MTAEPLAPYVAVRRAARGDLEAQRWLANAAFAEGLASGDRAAVAEGLCFARMAVSQDGSNGFNLGALFSLLALASDLSQGEPGSEEYRTARAGELVAYLSHGTDRLADISGEAVAWHE